MSPELQAACGEMPKAHLTYIVTAYGKPRSKHGLGIDFAEWASQGGIAGTLSSARVKKAGMRRRAEADNTVHELMAFSGHKTLAEVQRYTEAASRRRGSPTAASPRYGEQKTTGLTQTPTPSYTNRAKKPRISKSEAMSCYSTMEKQPQMRLSMRACRKLATSGPSSRDINSGLVSIDSPCSEYLGHHQVHGGHALARLLHHGANLPGLRHKIALGGDRRQLQLDEADDHAVGSLVQSAKSAHGSLLRVEISTSASGSRARPIYTLRSLAGLRILRKSAAAPCQSGQHPYLSGVYAHNSGKETVS